MKKYINLKSIILGTLLIISASCKEDQDVEGIVSTSDYPIATFEVIGSTDVGDRDGGIVFIKVSTDKAINSGVNFSATQTGGTATEHEDFDIVNTTIQAYYTEAIIEVHVYPDLEEEGDETIELQLTAPSLANKYLLNPTTVFPSITISIKDYVFCAWQLDGVDTYGDGWNGASIRLNSEGTFVDYAVEEAAQSWIVPVTKGEAFSFEFISGDWDGEIEYTLTAPDGTVYADAYYPAVGEITSGTCE